MKDDIQPEALRALAEAAKWTGKWYDAGCNTVYCTYDKEDSILHDEIAHPVPFGVSGYIAAAHPRAVIALLDRIAELESELEAVDADRAMRAQAAPAAVAGPSDAVAYIDIGAGGYLDLGSDLSDEALRKLPKGRHMLAIVGTYGVDGYAPVAAPTTQPEQVAQGDALNNTVRVPLDSLHADAAYLIGRLQRGTMTASRVVEVIRDRIDAAKAALTTAAAVPVEQRLDDIEQYRMQMAGICTASIGYWKAGDSVHPDYDTPALREVAALYEKYDELFQRNSALADWVASRWRDEVANRPLINKSRRPLDDTWRQVLRHLGVDDEARLGPRHDDLLAAAPKAELAPTGHFPDAGKMVAQPAGEYPTLPLAITSAPERIWLDLGFNPYEEDAHFSNLHDLTWSKDNATGDGIEYIRADRAMRAQAAPAAVAGPSRDLYPEKCPITGRPFFMVLDHPELGPVPTYGGPFDSYTIPAPEGEPTDPWHERELRCERFDHDAGYWVEGGEPIPLRIVHDDVLDQLQSDAAAPTTQATPQPAAQQGDELPREDFAWLVVQEACETEPADEDDPECIRILRRDLKSAVLSAFLRHDAAHPAAPVAQGDAEDTARLDFMIEHRAYVVSDPDACPGYWLHFVHKETGRTWVQGDEHTTPRAAIDAARSQAKEGANHA